MFMYEGYEVKDVILNNETAEEAAKRNGITLTLIKEERLQVFYFDATIYVSSASCEISIADFPWRAEKTLQALVS